MTNNIKKFSLLILSILLTTFITIGCLGFMPASANSMTTLTADTITIGDTSYKAQTFTVDGNTETIRFAMAKGAAIRMEEPTGIRFITYMSRYDYENLVEKYGKENVDIGTLVYVGSHDNLTLDTKGVGNIKIEKASIVTDLELSKDEVLRFSAVIANVPQKYYQSQISARSYITVNGCTAYTQFNSVDNSRSVSEVAKIGLVAQATTLSNDTRLLIESFTTIDNVATPIVIDTFNTLKEQLDESPLMNGQTVKYAFDPQVVGEEYSQDIKDDTTFLQTYNTGSRADRTKLVTVYTQQGEILNVPIVVATRAIGTKTDLTNLAKKYKNNVAGEYYALTANIDAGNVNLTNYFGGSWKNANPWYATFDGQGYAIQNVKFTNGLFPNIATTGVVTNLGLINGQKAVNGGGLISNECAGEISNCFVQGSIETGDNNGASQGGLVNVAYATAKIENNVVIPTYTNGGTNALGNLFANPDKVKNNIAISNVTQLTNSAINTTNNLMYLTAQAYADDYINKIDSFNNYWVNTQIFPILRGMSSAYNVNAYSKVFKQHLTLEIGLKNTANSVYLPLVDKSLDSAQNVASVSVDGVSVPFTVDGANVIFDGNAISNKTQGEKVITIAVGSNAYSFNVNAYTFVINDLEGLKEFFSIQASNKAGETYILNADIDALGFDFSTLYDNATRANQSWIATFDGRGHTIKNAKFYMGFLPQINGYDASTKTFCGTTVRNLSLVDPIDSFIPTASLPCGFLARRNLNSGLIENCYVKGVLTHAYYGGLVGQNGPGKTGHEATTIKNCVAQVEMASSVAGSDFGGIASNSFYSCGKYINTYLISKNVSLIANTEYGTFTNTKIYTDYSQLYADTTSQGATTLLSGQGYWLNTSDGLTFGDKVIDNSHNSVARYVVENGVANYIIVLPNNFTHLEEYSALQLQLYVEKATGALLPICVEANVPSTANNIISVGRTSDYATYLKTASAQSFNIYTTEKGSVHIVGFDDYGTLFGVYEWLSTHIGWDCISVNEVVYDQTESVKLLDADYLERPTFKIRPVGNIQAYMDNELAYLFRFTRNNGGVLTYVNGRNQHNAFSYLPPATYNDSSITETYHPDWYSTANVQDNAKIQLCYTAHGNTAERNLMLTTVAQVLFDTVRASTDSEITVQFSMEDNVYWCTCSSCTASKNTYGTNVATVIKFCNELHALLDTKMQAVGDYRTVNLIFFAYLGCETAPVKTNANGTYSPIDQSVVCAENVYPMYALAYGEYTSPLGSNDFEGRNQATNSPTDYYNNLKKWSCIADKLYVWMYGASFYDLFIPYDSITYLQQTLRVLSEFNVHYVFQEGAHVSASPNVTGFTVFKDYISSKLMWNVNADVSEITDTFFNEYFGKASTSMRKYYDELMAQCQAQKSVSGYDANTMNGELLKTAYWPQAKLNTWLTYIDQAYSDIEYLKDIDMNRYNELKNRIKLESLAIRYILANLYTTTLEFRQEFKADAVALGYTYIGFRYADIQKLWDKLGV